MTATMTTLEGFDGNSLAYSFIIEGFGTVFATRALPGAFSGATAPYNQWSDPTKGSMKVEGTLSQGIKLYSPDINPSTISVTFVDADETLIGALFRENSSAGHTTYLTSSVTAGSTSTWNVQSTTGFAASGTIYCGGEAVAYSGKTATTFTGITRAVYGVNLTDSGARYSPSHLIGNNVSINARTAPAVTDYPRTWYGRFCHLLVHVADPVTGTFNTADQALKIVSGRIEGYQDNGDGSITIDFKDAKDLLYKQIGADQWSASVNPGIYLAASTQDTLIVARVSSSATNYRTSASMGLASGSYSHERLATSVNAQLQTWAGAGATTAGDAWVLSLVDPGDGGPLRYLMRVDANTTAFGTGDNVGFGLHPLAMSLLGFGELGHPPTSGLGDAVTYGIAMDRISSTRYELLARYPPVQYYYVAPFLNVALTLAGEINSFVTQAQPNDFSARPDADGVVEISGGKYSGVYAVDYTAATASDPARIKILAEYDRSTGSFLAIDRGGAPSSVVRLGENGDSQPVVKQVIYYRGNAGNLMLRCLLSSGGASGYNSTAYDTATTAGFGAGVPTSLVDVDSWLMLDDVKIALIVREPKPFYEYLEPILATSGRYVVWKASSATAQPKLTIVRPALDSVFQNTWSLTESNKADSSRTKVSRAADGLISRISVKYGQGISKDTEQAINLTVDDLPSQSDYGRRRTLTINAGPVINVPEVVSQAIAPALTYFSRPVATAERSYNASLLRMAPGDSATLTDSYVADPATGARGATIYAWVLDTRIDLSTGKGVVRVVWLPEKNVTYTGTWAPSARVDETAGGGGYSGDVSKILTFKAHEFSSSSASSTDAEQFPVGAKVRIIQLDAAVPITWVDTIAAAPSTTTRTLTTGSGGLFDSTKRYVMENDDISTVTSTQRNSAYNADAATMSTGFTPSTPYEWGHRPGVVSAPSPDYSVGMFRPGTLYDDQGEPMSAHTVAYLRKAANNLLGYRTRNVLVSTFLPGGGNSVVGTSDALMFVAWCPFFGHHGLDGTRDTKVRLRIKQAGGGTATFTVASSLLPPETTGLVYPTGKSTVSTTTVSATDVWSSELTLTTFVRPQPGLIKGTWISVYGHGSGGGITANLTGISAVEAGL